MSVLPMKDWLRVLSLSKKANSWKELAELSGYSITILQTTKSILAPSYRFSWQKE